MRKLLLPTLLLLPLLFQSAISQDSITEVASANRPGINRDRGVAMLDQIKKVIKEMYYDKTFHGIDLDARFKEAKERVKKQDTNRQIFRTIAQVVLDFDDSHTTFFPPGRANRVEYGFSTQMFGPNCFVVDVKKGSDAEAKGLKPGDQILMLYNAEPTRDTLWKIQYVLYALDPQAVLNMTVMGPDRVRRDVQITPAFKSIEQRRKEADKRRKEKREDPYRCAKFDGDTIACKLKTFSVDKKYIDRMMKEISESKKLILDLRGNGGGLVAIEEYLTGFFFDHDVKIANFVTRDKTKERIAKTQKERVFKGDMIVLVDSNSASASEVFARVMQLEKRAQVMGDVSAGAVMTSVYADLANVRGPDDFATVSFFGMSVTIADLVMSDGNRLEKVGVKPDYEALPMASSMSLRQDPVLAYAASKLGSHLTLDEASAFRFLQKKDEDDDSDSDDDKDK